MVREISGDHLLGMFLAVCRRPPAGVVLRKFLDREYGAVLWQFQFGKVKCSLQEKYPPATSSATPNLLFMQNAAAATHKSFRVVAGIFWRRCISGRSVRCGRRAHQFWHVKTITHNARSDELALSTGHSQIGGKVSFHSHASDDAFFASEEASRSLQGPKGKRRASSGHGFGGSWGCDGSRWYVLGLTQWAKTKILMDQASCLIKRQT